MESGKYGLIPPSPLKLSGNFLENWREFKEEFKIYLVAAEGNGELAEKVKVALFLNLIGKDGYKIHKLIKYSTSAPEKRVTLKTVMDGFADFFTTCHNSELFNSFKFEKKQQLDGENFDDFLIEIAVMATCCKFPDTMIERRIRDKIVSGISDSDLSMKLMMLEDQSLESIINFCREAEKRKNIDRLSNLNLSDNMEFFLSKNILRSPVHNRSDISKWGNDSSAEASTSRRNKDSTERSLENEIDKILNEEPLSNARRANVASISREESNDGAPVENEDMTYDDDPEWDPNKKKRQMNNPKTKSKKVYECPHCSKKYVRLDHFKNHEKLHTGEGLVSCNICMKSYSCAKYLRSHMVHHSNLSCKKCGKSFTCKNHLSMHSYLCTHPI